MAQRHSVLIPIVAAGKQTTAKDGAQRLIECYSVYFGISGFGVSATRSDAKALDDKLTADTKALDRYWDQVAAPLRPAGPTLYRAGCAAVSAVRRLGLTSPRGALFQKLRPQACIDEQGLYCADSQGPTEGRSAELGLALALLLGASNARHNKVIATGALTGTTSTLHLDDVEVLAVEAVPLKLELVLRHAERGELPESDVGKNYLFFTPTDFEVNGVQQKVNTLPIVDSLAKHGVRVVPVNWLSEVASQLGARSTRMLWRDRLLQAVSAMIVLIVVAIVGWSRWDSLPIPMTFVAAVTGVDSKPFETCFVEQRGYYPVPLQQQGLTPVIAPGKTLGWKVQVGDSETIEANLLSVLRNRGSYYLAHILLAEYSPAKIMLPTDPLKPGDVLEWGWKLSDTAETNTLVLMAQRHEPFDAAKLRKELIIQFPAAAGGEKDQAGLDITAATNYLATRASGVLSFTFLTREQGSQCIY